MLKRNYKNKKKSKEGERERERERRGKYQYLQTAEQRTRSKKSRRVKIMQRMSCSRDRIVVFLFLLCDRSFNGLGVGPIFRLCFCSEGSSTAVITTWTQKLYYSNHETIFILFCFCFCVCVGEIKLTCRLGEIINLVVLTI